MLTNDKRYTQGEAKLTAGEFFKNYGADDILYALAHREYFNLSTEEHQELTALVFKAIDAAR